MDRIKAQPQAQWLEELVPDAIAYCRWITALAQGIGNGAAGGIFEPDAVPLTTCMTPVQEQEQYGLIRFASDSL